MTTKTASWHPHHNEICEWDTEPRESRIAYIKIGKPECERPLRLRLYQPMSAEGCRLLELFEAARAEAGRVYKVADAEADRVYKVAEAEADKVLKAARNVREATLAEAKKVYDAARNEARMPLEALHKIECPACPWDGVSIFANTEENATP